MGWEQPCLYSNDGTGGASKLSKTSVLLPLLVAGSCFFAPKSPPNHDEEELDEDNDVGGGGGGDEPCLKLSIDAGVWFGNCPIGSGHSGYIGCRLIDHNRHLRLTENFIQHDTSSFDQGKQLATKNCCSGSSTGPSTHREKPSSCSTGYNGVPRILFLSDVHHSAIEGGK
ncbi:hypothetical protein F3Y22_tig00110945pilonHSYRG00035 [Hibiscus syriacus]|uniref:Uncharacterized protein n=1 Tax=Hibiscus syriacus TaxID=106335 RepID=A0A6A2ZC38_HIBSY|nr:hypothetical protein F3Y22_tig00110945pilonHSYRG00035 [Hibiscus syriacus]